MAAQPHRTAARRPSPMLFLAMAALLAALLPLPALAVPDAAAVSCAVDADCSALNARLQNALPSTGASSQHAGYSCIQGVCKYLVSAGFVCLQASDCALYHFTSSAIARNNTAVLPSEALANTPAYLNSICAPQYCTIASSCQTATSDPLFSNPNQVNLPHVSQDMSCCRGADTGAVCLPVGASLDPCNVDSACKPNPESPNQLTCGPIQSHSSQWIGIVISLFGAATLNIGLNLQKFALRKRHEKVVRKKEAQRSVVIQKIASIRISLSDFYKKYSMNTLTFGTRRSSSNTSSPPTTMDASNMRKTSASSSAEPLSESTRSDQPPNTPPLPTGNLRSSLEAAPSLAQKPSNLSLSAGAKSDVNDTDTRIEDQQTIHDISRATPLAANANNDAIVVAPRPRPRRRSVDSSHRKSAGNMSEMLDKPEFQKKLHFGSLVRNPAWVLGMLVFILGNFFNFIALQFAAQSVLGPLGSISLVVNVIIAPIINKETWTWKDIVGVILIVGGSSLVVAFAGVSDKDYDLCVLLRLFKLTPTIVFLTVTASLLCIVFLMIAFVERNLDILEEPSPATINETLGGQLVHVETHFDHHHHAQKSGTHGMDRHSAAESGVHRVRSSSDNDDEEDVDEAVIADPSKGIAVRVRDVPSPSGTLRRTLTITEVVPHEHAYKCPGAFPDESTSSGMDYLSPFAAGPSHAGISEMNSAASDALLDMRLAAPDAAETVADLLNSRDADGHSIKSVSLTFVIDNKNNKKETQPASALLQPRMRHSAFLGNLSIPLSGRRHSSFNVDVERPGTRSLDLDRDNQQQSDAHQHSDSDNQMHSDADQVGPLVSTMQRRRASMPFVGSSVHDQTQHANGFNVAQVSTENSVGDDHEIVLANPATESELVSAHRHDSPKEQQIVSAEPATLARSQTSNASMGSQNTWRQRLRRRLESNAFMRALFGIKLVPRLRKKIPLDSFVVRVLLPLSYASLGGLMGTITVLFAKATTHLISTSVFQGVNQFNNFGAWVISGVTIFTAVGQLYWINMGLQRYDALLQIPVYYVVWTIFDVIGGGIYFDEFRGFTATKFGLFCLGLFIIFMGVAVLATRLKALTEEEMALANGEAHDRSPTSSSSSSSMTELPKISATLPTTNHPENRIEMTSLTK